MKFCQSMMEEKENINPFDWLNICTTIILEEGKMTFTSVVEEYEELLNVFPEQA